jgi:tetratricopeptide (TPR) repeat protein
LRVGALRSSASVKGLATLACAVSFACASGAPALAARVPDARPEPVPTTGAVAQAARPAPPAARVLAPSREVIDEAALRLGRAAMERSVGNLRGVVENLAVIDFSSEPPFADADRAAFLLGQAYLEMGGRARFVALARQVGTWRRTSPYTRWLAFQLALAETELADSPPATADSSAGAGAPGRMATSGAGGAAADALAAAVLLRDGNPATALALIAAIESRGEVTPLVTWLKAQALSASGADDGAEWTRLADADTTTPIGRDLAGAALVRLATRAAERGEDPRPLLARVPAGGRYASRARHMAGLAALERGEAGPGAAILAGLAAGDSSYAARREVWLALAGEELDAGRWDAAHTTYRQIDKDWMHHRDVLRRLLAGADHDSLWRAWEANSPLSPALMLDALPARLLAEGLADASEDLTTRPAADLPALGTPAPAAESPWSIAPPPPEVWRALAGSARDLGEAQHALARTRWARAREQETLEGTRRYLAGGLERARREVSDLTARTSLLDSLMRTLEALDARLKAARDEATRRITRRTIDILQACVKDLTWMQAMRHFHLAGPERERAVPAPEAYPLPDSVLAGEEALARAVQAFAERMATEGPDLIARSYDGAWRPGLVDRAAEQDRAAHAALAWARALAVSIDSTIASTSTSEALRRLVAREDSLVAATAALRAAHQAARARAAHQAIAGALKALDTEREGIDYGLAASAYGLGVRLGPPGAGDSLVATTRPRPSPPPKGGARDTSAVGAEPVDEMDQPEAVRWRGEAVALHRAFLERHPESPARGEIRFRLADLLLVEARREFRDRMAAYVKDQAEGGARGVPLPVLSHAQALALYRSILAEDPGFEHRDAALFNAAMILADGGDPEAERMFDRLVTAHPESPYCQEAYLRMGDMHFNAKRYAESIRLYQRAATGADAGLQAIALYKSGWAHYNQDRFAEAADAFGAVLDLYGTDRRGEIQADIEGEAEAYLVHSLAGAGGAEAFVTHFGRAGPRPYEMRILMALGQHFRRFGQYPQAAATDQLCLSRYPKHADALLSAQRLIDTHQRANLPDRAREARLSFSARFAPGSAWFQAQSSDSVRTAGEAFARTSLRTVAQEYHHRARETKAAADWRAALDLYEQVLTAWPDDADAGHLALRAGEAGAQLGEYPRALRHYDAAARSDQDSVAAQAMWQRVAVTDAWYESTRGPAGPGRAATGRDSLARAVLGAADRLIERFPDHPQGADLMWRQGNLAFAHGWLDSSARHFGRLATRHPGDQRAPRAAILRADALYRLQKFDAAGGAYEEALAIARQAGADSLRRRAEQAIPVAYYRHAESAVAEDSSRFERHATLFQQVATRWPRYEHAHLAQYRAGLAWSRAGQQNEAVRALQAVIDSFPGSTYVRDAQLEIAKAWEAGGEKEKSAAGYARFAERFPKDPGAADAWLKAADLYAAAGKEEKALEIRLAYIKRYPNDVETAMEVYEALAVKELATVGPSRPISTLLPPAAESATGAKGAKGTKATKGTKGGKGAKLTPSATPPALSHLAEYLKRAKTHPSLASNGIMAQVNFLKAEEARPAYEGLRIRQPLPPSIAAKQKSLDHLMGLYRQSVDLGVPEWAHASTFRIGEALVAFGDALEKSERPADLTGDGLQAYEDVLFERAGQFAERGEGVWSELLRQKGKEAGNDPWIAKAQGALWQQLGERFTGIPEADYPLLAARAVEKRKIDDERSERKSAGRRDSTERPRIQKQEDRP